MKNWAKLTRTQTFSPFSVQPKCKIKKTVPKNRKKPVQNRPSPLTCLSCDHQNKPPSPSSSFLFFSAKQTRNPCLLHSIPIFFNSHLASLSTRSLSSNFQPVIHAAIATTPPVLSFISTVQIPTNRTVKNQEIRVYIKLTTPLKNKLGNSRVRVG